MKYAAHARTESGTASAAIALKASAETIYHPLSAALSPKLFRYALKKSLVGAQGLEPWAR